MKFHEWGVGVDPDESCWVESVKYNISFLVVIRVFYEIGPPAFEEIGTNSYLRVFHLETCESVSLRNGTLAAFEILKVLNFL